MNCLECGNPFKKVRYDQKYCSAKCSRAHNNRRLTRGSTLLDIMLYARRNKDRKALKLANKVIDQYIAEDNAAGRLPGGMPHVILAQIGRI